MQFQKIDSIIICLKPSSLLSCIELAAHLHAYIYQLWYEPVDDPFNITRTLGAVLPSGKFVLNPEISRGEYDYICSEFQSHVLERQRVAASRINKNPHVDHNIDLHVANGRNVLLFGDILKDIMEIEVAKTLLKPLSPTSINGVGGNITSDVSLKFQIDTDSVTYMDVLPHSIFDDDHYFEQPDPYPESQKISLAQNISLYWA
jgi:Uri superfamily endonuclease